MKLWIRFVAWTLRHSSDYVLLSAEQLEAMLHGASASAVQRAQGELLALLVATTPKRGERRTWLH